MIKLKNILTETPDEAVYHRKTLYFRIPGAYAFGYLDGKMWVSNENGIHGNRGSREEFTWPGRIWIKNNVISFWDYPPKNEMKKTILDLEKAFKDTHNIDISIYDNPKYRIETLVSIDTGEQETNPDDEGDYVSATYDIPDSGGEDAWEMSQEIAAGYGYKIEFVHPKKYSGSLERDEKELAMQHIMSPLLKAKRKPKGWGSTKDKTKTLNPRLNPKLKYGKERAYWGDSLIKKGKILKEEPDHVNYNDKILLPDDDDAISYLYDTNGTLWISPKGKTHSYFYRKVGGNINFNFNDSGRLWLNSKVISMWNKSINEIELKKIIYDLESKLKIKIMNNGWVVETANDKWNNLIPVEKYVGNRIDYDKYNSTIKYGEKRNYWGDGVVKKGNIIKEVELGSGEYDDFHPLGMWGVKPNDRSKKVLKNAVNFKGYRFLYKHMKRYDKGTKYNLFMYLPDRPFLVGVIELNKMYLDEVIVSINGDILDSRLPHLKAAVISTSAIHERFRGKGLGYIMYQYVMNGVDVLVSDASLQEGAYAVWKKLGKNNGTVCGIDRDKDELFKLNLDSFNDVEISDRLILFINNKKLPKELKTKNSMKLPEVGSKIKA